MQDALTTFGRGVRKAIHDATALNDVDAADLFTEISRGVDNSLWMVEAHVEDAQGKRNRSRSRPPRGKDCDSDHSQWVTLVS
jgi:hypothetical protein